MTVNISLTQFLSYSSKVSTSAKMNEIKRIKNNDDYSPATDYWKPLRDEIKRLYENGIPINELALLVEQVNEKKKRNYARAISKFLHFSNSNNPVYFETGKSFWKLSDELFVGTSPELGLTIDGQNYYVKNWYKKPTKDAKVNQRNIQSALTMMQLSECNFSKNSTDKFAILNLQNGKLIEAKPLISEAILELEFDAHMFVDIWNKI